MNQINLKLVKFLLGISALLVMHQVVVRAEAPNGGQQEPVKRNDLVNEAKKASNQTNIRSRSGRMLDLDLLTGDINKDQKVAKEQSVSGARQSRILSEDLPMVQSANRENVEPRSRRKTKSKGMSIKGFIPIVSLDGHSKDGKNLLDGPDSDESESEESSQDEQVQSGGPRDQVAASFGAQTSIGHASFATNDQQAQQAQWQQPTTDQEAARANRRLLGSSNILSGLTSSKRFVSSLVPSAPFGAGSLGQPFHQLQGPMNVPPVASVFEQHQQQQAECICVPFFQCKNGYLTESQLSKSQLAQISASHSHQANQYQVPRSLAAQRHQQMANELYYTSQSPAAAMSTSNADQTSIQNQFPSQPSDQQMVNDIYEQLRKNIESSQLEQQLKAYQAQQQQQQQQQQQPFQNFQESLVDERSKSAGNSTLDGVEERSLFNQLANRRSSASPQRCGIMRTCCRVPPSIISGLLARPAPLGPHQLAANPRLISQQQQQQTMMMGLASRPQPFLAAGSQPNYQVMQQAQQQPQPAPPMDSLVDYQQPSLADQLQGQSQFLGQAQQPQRAGQSPVAGPPQASGQFMSGRCGVRQALGISGRVQNSQPGVENQADFGEFPAHAAILRRVSPGDSLFVCSAVLVSSQWLATAAHCVKKMRPDELKVRLGEWDVNRDDEFYPFVERNVREIIIQPEFQASSLANDLALLRLDAPVADQQQQVPHVAPACLATPDEQLAGQRCWVAGWGKDAFGQSGSFQSVLKKVDLPVVARADCELALRHHTKLGRHFRLHSNNICAGGERGKDACEGDGGAGLYCLDAASGLVKAAGLVSWGVGCGQGGVPGVYVNLANFYPWIESVVAQSGEENVYLDGRNQALDANFKSIITERTINGTAPVTATEQAGANATDTATRR